MYAFGKRVPGVRHVRDPRTQPRGAPTLEPGSKSRPSGMVFHASAADSFFPSSKGWGGSSTDGFLPLSSSLQNLSYAGPLSRCRCYPPGLVLVLVSGDGDENRMLRPEFRREAGSSDFWAGRASPPVFSLSVGLIQAGKNRDRSSPAAQQVEEPALSRRWCGFDP